MRLDIIEFRREIKNRPVKIEIEEPTEVTVKVATKDAQGNMVIEERLEPRMVKKTVDRIIQEEKEYVEYAAPGRRQFATTVKTLAEIKGIKDVTPGEEDDDDRAVEAAKRDYILAAYDAWKRGHEMPANGTPLGAWPAISPKTAEQFRLSGVRTVEEVAELNEQAKSRLGHIGHLGDLIKQAKLFLGSADKLAVAHNMKALEDQNTALKDQLADQEAALKEMHAMLMELKQQAPGASDKPKRSKAEVAA